MTDLISRADAVNAVHKYFVDAFNNEPHEIDEDGDDVFTDMKSVNALLHHNKMVSKALKSLPSAGDDWIPCSERLPQIGTTVITCDADGDIHLDYIIKLGDSSFGFCQTAAYGDSDVLAWRPLPTPYKGGDDE